MTSQRLRFLASLSERLGSDLAWRERNRDDDSPPLAGLEPTGRPGGDYQPSPDEEVAGDEIVSAPARPAAQVEAEQAPGSEAVAPPQRGIGASVSEGGRTRPAVPWSETGMPTRLREAIASVRRVSNEMQDVPPDDYARGRDSYPDPTGYRDYPFDDGAAYQEPPPDDARALLERDATPEDDRIDPGFDAAYEKPSPHDQPHQLDEDEGFRREQMRLDEDGDFEEPPLRFVRHAGYGEPPSADEATPRDQDAAYEGGSPADAAAHAHLWLEDDGAAPESVPGRWDAPHGRATPRRGATRGYGVLAVAFAIAVALVALAGFGLGILSGGGEVGDPLARDTARAAPTPPAPLSAGQNPPPREPEKPTGLSELVTERVAPARIAAVPEPAPVGAAPEPAPAARVSTSAPPLPPPPKPALPPSAAAQAPSPDGELAGVVEDAAAALLETDGAGGPFEPLFAKLPGPLHVQTRVFVHYTANAVGAPATAMHLVRHLKAEGFAAEARAVESPIPSNSIRYFFESDREQAEALGSSLEAEIPDGAALSVRDFTFHEPRPRPGVIEIWLGA